MPARHAYIYILILIWISLLGGNSSADSGSGFSSPSNDCGDYGDCGD